MKSSGKRKTRAPLKYVPATQQIDLTDLSSEEYPSEVSSDCEIIEIDISSDSEEEKMASPPLKQRSLKDSFKPPRNTITASAVSEATSTSIIGDVESSSSVERGPKRSVEFMCAECGFLNRFEALNCLHCNTLQRFQVCSHCVMQMHQ